MVDHLRPILELFLNRPIPTNRDACSIEGGDTGESLGSARRQWWDDSILQGARSGVKKWAPLHQVVYGIPRAGGGDIGYRPAGGRGILHRITAGRCQWGNC